MDGIKKFEGVDYENIFTKRIIDMHELVKKVLSDKISDGDGIIDIGGGPGISAKIIEELGVKAIVTNIEPSNMIYNVPSLSLVEYIPLNMSLKEALDAHMPYTADFLLMVSSAHEIALCNNMKVSTENKKIFFNDLKAFVRKNLKRNGSIIIGFPNYKVGVSKEEIARQRGLTESLLGHSHPPDEYFTVEEFSTAFGIQPTVFVQKPMNLTHENSENSILIANVAVFEIKNFKAF